MADRDQEPPIVLIWDLDETLIILHSLLNGAWSAAHGQHTAAEAQILGDSWQDAILSLCDHHLFFSELDECDQDTLLALSQYDDGRSLADYDFASDSMDGQAATPANLRKIAYRYRRIAQLYRRGLEGIVSSAKLAKYNELYRETDQLAGGWLQHGIQLLSACLTCWPQRACAEQPQQTQQAQQPEAKVPADAAAPHIAGSATKCQADGPSSVLPSLPGRQPRIHHVVVTAGQLVPTVGKLLAFKLDRFFAPGDIYSSRNYGKTMCFRMIAARFGQRNVRFCVIGDGPEEEAAAALRSWPFVRVLLTPFARSAAAPPEADVSPYATELSASMKPDATSTLGTAFMDLSVDMLARVVDEWPRRR